MTYPCVHEIYVDQFDGLRRSSSRQCQFRLSGILRKNEMIEERCFRTFDQGREVRARKSAEIERRSLRHSIASEQGMIEVQTTF